MYVSGNKKKKMLRSNAEELGVDLCWKTGWNIPTAQADFYIKRKLNLEDLMSD